MASIDNKLLLVKCITLLYRESTLPEKESNSADLVRTVLEAIKLPEQALSMNSERDVLMGLKETALYLCGNPLITTYEKEELLQRLKVNCGLEDSIYEAFQQGIETEMSEATTKRNVLSIRKYIDDSFRENELVKIISKASSQVIFNRDKIPDIKSYVKDLIMSLEPYQMSVNQKDPAVIASVDIGDEAGMTEVCNKIQEQDNQTSILKTGWQGINRMLQGGFRRGTATILGALQHNYKTGFSLTVFKQIAMYNDPVMTNMAKKPLLLRITFEDSLTDNIQFLYQNCYQNEHGVMPNIKAVKPKEMTAYVKEKLSVTGYHVKFMQVNPSNWTYKDIQNAVIGLEAEGYEIHLLMLDYLAMIPTTGCEQGTMGHDMRDMWRRMRSFCMARQIALVSPHQLSSDAKMLIREGRTDFVKAIANKGYWDGSKRLDQEVDLELYQNIERKDGVAYLTIQRGKHRTPTVIPETDKYMVLKFTEKGCILDDVGKPDSTLKKVGGGAIGSSDEIPFYEFQE